MTALNRWLTLVLLAMTMIAIVLLVLKTYIGWPMWMSSKWAIGLYITVGMAKVLTDPDEHRHASKTEDSHRW